MGNELLKKPGYREWSKCLLGSPEVCNQIFIITGRSRRIKTFSTKWRHRLNSTRESVDAVRFRCRAVHDLNRDIRGRIKTMSDVPCEKLRLEIMEERLNGIL